MQIRLGLLAASSVLAAACFNPPDPPAETEDGGTDASDDSTTSAGPGGTPTETPMEDSTGPTESPCDPNPCQNDGECIPDGDGTSCVCPEGFSGDICELEPSDPCAPNPCENEGRCIVGMEGVVCDCPNGFEGDLCEVDIDECAGDPCLNGGTCIDEIGGFACNCPGGFEGVTCEVNIDDCAATPCVNGTCVDGIESFECDCGAMFEGDLCECSVGSSTQVNYTNQGTFTAASLFDPPGVTVTGSNTINVLNLNGLGIVGGVNDNTVDGSEWIEFTFDHPSTATTYFVPSAGNQDGDGFVGEAFVQAWDEGGVSLGINPVNGVGNFDLNAMFGAGVRITRFRATANVDNFRVGNVNVSFVVCP